MYQADIALLRWANAWAFKHLWSDVAIVFAAVFLGYWMLAGLLAFGAFTIAPLSKVFPSFAPLRRRNWEMIGATLLSAFVARFGVVELIRFFYDRPRPFEVLSDIHQLIFRDGGGSFPSGHAAFYFAIAAGVGRYYPKTGIAFYAAALSLSLARVAAGVHWPSDVVGGAVVGIATALFLPCLIGRFRKPKPAA